MEKVPNLPWRDYIIVSQEVGTVRWSVDELDVAQVPSEIGWAAFPITCSEASNRSQCVIKWSLGWRECRWTWKNSIVFHQQCFLCPHKQWGISFNLSEVPSNLCFTCKSLSYSQEHTMMMMMYSSVPAARKPLEGKKQPNVSICMDVVIWNLQPV